MKIVQNLELQHQLWMSPWMSTFLPSTSPPRTRPEMFLIRRPADTEISKLEVKTLWHDGNEQVEKLAQVMFHLTERQSK